MKCCINKFAALCSLLSALCSAAYACPSCKEALSANGGGLARGFYWSILLMLGMTFLVVAVIAGTVMRAQRKAGRETSEGR